MEVFSQVYSLARSSAFGTATIAVSVLLLSVYVLQKLTANKYKLPPGPKGWPVVGSLLGETIKQCLTWFALSFDLTSVMHVVSIYQKQSSTHSCHLEELFSIPLIQLISRKCVSVCFRLFWESKYTQCFWRLPKETRRCLYCVFRYLLSNSFYLSTLSDITCHNKCLICLT